MVFNLPTIASNANVKTNNFTQSIAFKSYSNSCYKEVVDVNTGQYRRHFKYCRYLMSPLLHSFKYRKVFWIQFTFRMENYTLQASCRAALLLPCIKVDLVWRKINTCFGLKAMVDANWHNVITSMECRVCIRLTKESIGLN